MESAADLLRRKERLAHATPAELDTFLERFLSATQPGDVTR